MKNSNEKTQQEKLAELLIAIRENVTTEDRKELMKEVEGLSRPTVSRYLHGDVRSVDTGMKIYTFLKKRIEKREKALA